nr:MAG TPA: hypothetical protein [Caudoviricetes sp.]
MNYSVIGNDKRECNESRKNQLDDIRLNPKCFINRQSAAKSLIKRKVRRLSLGVIVRNRSTAQVSG